MPAAPGVPSAEELSALPAAELAARLAEAYRLIGELTARAEQLTVQSGELAAQVGRLQARVEDLERSARKDSLLTEQPRVFSQLGTLAEVLGCTVTAHDQRAGAGPFGARGAAGGCAGEDREPV